MCCVGATTTAAHLPGISQPHSLRNVSCMLDAAIPPKLVAQMRSRRPRGTSTRWNGIEYVFHEATTIVELNASRARNVFGLAIAPVIAKADRTMPPWWRDPKSKEHKHPWASHNSHKSFDFGVAAGVWHQMRGIKEAAEELEIELPGVGKVITL